MRIIGADYRRHVAHAVTALLATAMLLIALAGGARAAGTGQIGDEARVVLSDHVDVAPDETGRDVVVLHGAVTVDGFRGARRARRHPW